MVTSHTLVVFINVIVVMLVIIGIIFLHLVIKGRQERNAQQKINQYITCYEHKWYQYLVEGTIQIKGPRNHVEKAAVDRIFTTYMTTINNQEVKQRISHYAALNLQSFYLNQLRNKDLAIRLNVLQRTILFDLSFLLVEIEKHLKKKKIKSMEEYILCLRILSIHNTSLFLAHMYKPTLHFKEYEYKVILAQLDEKYIDYFKDNFDALPINLRLALLERLSLNSLLEQSYLHFYEQQLNSVYGEIRIRSLKAIASFGMLTAIEQYEPFVYSNEWQERLMVAKILRFSHDDKAYASLQQLIKDKHWQIRKQAAISLKSMRRGIAILQQIIEKSEDPYAKDIAKEVLKVG